mgnify:CR=1 FL=1
MQKWLMSGLVAAACLFGIGLLVFALPDKEKSAEPAESFAVPDVAVDAAAAEQIYKSNCLSCHGDQLQGRVGPELDAIGTAMTQEEIYKKIANGGGGMPKFKDKLTEEELTQITLWLAAKT